MAFILDAASIIDDLSTGTYVVTRRAAAGTDGHGRATAPSTTTLRVAGMLQPASGRDLLQLPELRRATETRVFFTAAKLRIGGQGDRNETDLITIPAADWYNDRTRRGTVVAEVQHVETWIAASGYCRCLLQANS